MKRILLGLMLLSGSSGYTQSYPCDIAQFGLGISPGSIAIGQTADFKFTVSNEGSNANCTIPAGSVTVILSLPSTSSGQPQYYQFVSVVSPVGGIGPYFTFTYDAGENAVIGTNRNPIPNGLGEANVTIRVIGIGVTSATGATALLSLQQANGVSNNPGNDVSLPTPLIVTPLILPIKLGNFQATSKGCQNTIEWTSLQEENTKSFVIEAGKDGLNFKTLKTLAAAGNSTARKNYSYIDAAPSNGVTYYRLKMVDADDKYIYSDVVNVRSDCGVKLVSVYPNPILIHQQKLNVTLSGYKGIVKGDLLAATGQIVQAYTLRNGSNTLTVGNLTLGSYVLRVTDVQTGEATSKKILVIR